MDWQQVFGLANMVALAGWAVLILAPRRIRWLDAVPRLAVPLGLAVLYAALILPFMAGTGGGFGSVAAVRQLFASDPVLTAGWVHYLAFDMLVGSYLADRMDRAGTHRLIQAPVLGVTFLLGPIGYLIGTAVLAGARRRVVEA